MKKYVHVALGTPQEVYSKLIVAYSFSPHASINKSKLNIWINGYVYNPLKINFDNLCLFVCDKNEKTINLNQSTEKFRKRNFIFHKTQKITFDIADLLYENAKINCNIYISLTVDGEKLFFPVTYGLIKKKTRMNYVPFKSKYLSDYAIHLRKSMGGNLVFVRRLKEKQEFQLDFRIKESKIVSFVLYYLAKIYNLFAKKNVNLFYEKFASKAEEGAYNLFLEAKKRNTSESYYIIDSHSSDYEKIKNQEGVVVKFSWQYYWLLYVSSNFIATEAPIHINIIRSNNKYFRKSTFQKQFIFLQHGVTYLKCHDVNSPFVNGKEATPSYICVGSEKEKDIVSEMLNLYEEQILVTGLPVFSNIKWESMNESSKDIITVMLTWKPYEEYLTVFEESTYYKFTIGIYEMLKKYIPEDRIIIIPHPKIAHLMKNTKFKDNIWTEDISKALSVSKLLITDYSSVCYNSFYQGGGVVFFQPDLEYYEKVNGKLIPSEDEYIGFRTFNMEELEEVCSKGLVDKKIDLSYFRNRDFIDRYLTINEFTDGKNLERICQELIKLGIM